MSREAMQMALDALEDANDVARMEFSDENYYSEAINALRQALETEQKPVAWMYVNKDGECEQIEYGPVFDDPGVTPLYTAPPKRELTCVCGAVWEGETMVHPPRKREWVGLTHPQIHELDWPDGVSFEDILLFVRAIEQALKEKNHG